MALFLALLLVLCLWKQKNEQNIKIPAFRECEGNYKVNKNKQVPWLVQLRIGRSPMNQKAAGSIPKQDICLGYRPGPQLGAYER